MYPKEMPSKFLSVIIPVYNEGACIVQSIHTLTDYFADGLASGAVELIFVNDGSQDNTGEILDRYAAKTQGVRLIHLPRNEGKGYAVQCGLRNAKGQWWLFSDADLSTPIEEWEKLLQALKVGARLAIGSRQYVEIPQPRFRVWLGKLFRVWVHWMLTDAVWDTQCGFKMMDREFGSWLIRQQRIRRFGFDTEWIFLVTRNKVPFAEVPVRWRDSAKSSVCWWRDGWRMVWDVLFIRWNHWTGKYQPYPSCVTHQT